jgi:hypothetical protein
MRTQINVENPKFLELCLLGDWIESPVPQGRPTFLWLLHQANLGVTRKLGESRPEIFFVDLSELALEWIDL